MQPVCFETSDGVRLCYRENRRTAGNQPLLVFIPGWTMPSSVWEKQLAHFSGRIPWVAFDPRGQGHSAAPASGYTLERRIQDLHELFARFPQERIILIGWSLAVLEMLAYVERHGTGRVAGLVLVDNSVGEGNEEPRSGENPFFAELRADREAALRRFIDAMFRSDPNEQLKAEILASALKTGLEDSLRLLSWGKPRSYWKQAVYGVARPVLYLVTPRWREQAHLLAQHHPRATVEIFEQAGHALFWDEAERFNAALDAFIRQAAG